MMYRIIFFLTITPHKIIVQTLSINNYTGALGNLIPHTSVAYGIECYHDTTLVKSIQGILEGEQYKEWTTDDWLDRFIKSKVEELSDGEVKVEPKVEEHPDVEVKAEPKVEELNGSAGSYTQSE